MRFTIYHTNDIHSNYEALKRIHCFMKKEKKEEDLYFDSGDFTDIKSLVVQADFGLSAMDMFLQCGLDGMAIGNNEVDLTYEPLCKIAEKKMPVLSVNLTDNDDRDIPGLSHSRIYERGGKRLLVIGVAPFYRKDLSEVAGYNLFSMMGNLKYQDPIPAIRKELEEQKGHYDYCILLSHSGTNVDEALMKQYPEIDLCLGGHDHETICYPGYTQSATGMETNLGKVVLEIGEDGIREIENVQISLSEQEDLEFEQLLFEKTIYAEKILGKELPVVGELNFDDFGECEFINFICDCLHKKFGGDLAIMHHGIAEGPLVEPVSRKALLELLPSKLNPTIMPVKGENIIEAIRQSFDEKKIHEDGKGPGFRGHVLGTLGFSANVTVNPKTMEVFLDQQRMDPKKYIQ